MVRIAVLGAGSHSRHNHGSALRAVAAKYPEWLELAAVCDREAAKAQAYAADFGFGAVYQDLHQMVEAERPDGIVAVTPVPLTEEIVSQLLPYRIPLVIEKPPGPDAAAAARLIAQADTHGTPHQVSLNRRFTPPRQRAEQWLRHQVAERPVRLVLARMLRVDRREAEFVTSTGIHLVDAALSLAGPPCRVSARHVPSGAAGVGFTQAQVECRNGCLVCLTFAPVVGNVEETYELHGDDYTVQIDDGGARLAIWDRGVLADGFAAPADAEACYRNGTVAEMEQFVLAVAGQAPFGPDLRAARTALRVAEAIAAGGEQVLGD